MHSASFLCAALLDLLSLICRLLMAMGGDGVPARGECVSLAFAVRRLETKFRFLEISLENR